MHKYFCFQQNVFINLLHEFFFVTIGRNEKTTKQLHFWNDVINCISGCQIKMSCCLFGSNTKIQKSKLKKNNSGEALNVPSHIQ